MTTFDPQSTDRLGNSTNPDAAQAVLRGSVTVPVTLAGSWYSGTSSVTFDINTQYAGLNVDAWIRWQFVGGGNIVVYRKLPFDVYNGTTHSMNGYISITVAAKNNQYLISFDVGSTNAALVDPTIYYTIYSSVISPTGLSFT